MFGISLISHSQGWPDNEAARGLPRPPHLVLEAIMQRFTDLKVWQRSHAWVLAVYEQSVRFPEHERYGLTQELRRAARSVPSNIAEGSKRKSSRDYAHFLNIAEASLAEAEYQIVLARDLGYLSAEQAAPVLAEAQEIAPMLFRLRTKVERDA
jgi:four helix bundle protein